jgi:serine/threonine protein kinase
LCGRSGLWRSAVQYSTVQYSDRKPCIWYVCLQVFDAYTVDHYGRSAGVIIMDRVYSTLHDQLHRNPDDPVLVQWAADVLRSLVEHLAQYNFIHGDLHLGNVALDYYHHVKLIDFGYSFVAPAGSSVEVDTYMVWRASMNPTAKYSQALNKALLASGFPESKYVGRALEDPSASRPVFEEHSHDKLYDFAGKLLTHCTAEARNRVMVVCDFDRVQFSPAA